MNIKKYAAVCAAIMVMSAGVPIGSFENMPSLCTSVSADGYYYVLNKQSSIKAVLGDDGTLSISGYGEITNGSWVYKKDKTAIKSVVFEKGSRITSIGDGAFSGCTALESVKLPAYLKEIHANAFSGCGALSAVSIPTKCTVIGKNAFLGCTSLKKVTFRATAPIAFSTKSFADLTEDVTVEIPVGSTYGKKEILESLKNDRFASVFGDAQVIRKDTPDERTTPTVYADNGKITISWKGAENARYYNVYLMKNDGSLKKLTTTEKTTYVMNCKINGRYRFAIRAYINGKWTKVSDKEVVTILA